MELCKRRRPNQDPDEVRRPLKRRRVPARPDPAKPPADGRDRLSALSDELVLRVLSYLSLPHLLSLSSVSRRLSQLSVDPSLWRALYYSRFILPRALRIPGFRDGATATGNLKLHHSPRRAALLADSQADLIHARPRHSGIGPLCWKRQYKLRHNWAKGKCAMEELIVGGAAPGTVAASYEDMGTSIKGTLVKVIGGLAVTADSRVGLRAWRLKTRSVVAHINLRDGRGKQAVPTTLAIDDRNFAPSSALDLAVGFADGAFGIWRLNIPEREFVRRYRHHTNSGGELVAAAISLPYLLVASSSVMVSLFVFDAGNGQPADRQSLHDSHPRHEAESPRRRSDATTEPSLFLRPPRHFTSLKSSTSRAPLALSIRTTEASVIASVAYTFVSPQGWSVGIQDIVVERTSCDPKASTSRVAFTEPVQFAQGFEQESDAHATRIDCPLGGPTTLSYSHPYLLVTLPDNTLFLHVCNSTLTSLTIGSGMRLFGHTSGIGDAEITARGKAVSVSRHGEEILVWELEGTVPKGKAAIQLSPAPSPPVGLERNSRNMRRNWVGFDDEMVIVLQEADGGKESLVVYDFT